jgi:hypothetical protein
MTVTKIEKIIMPYLPINVAPFVDLRYINKPERNINSSIKEEAKT